MNGKDISMKPGNCLQDNGQKSGLIIHLDDKCDGFSLGFLVEREYIILIFVKGAPADGSEACNILEQPRGEVFYYCSGNGTKNLERMRIRTPTSQNLAGMTMAIKGCEIADVNMIVLSIGPCISCTER